MNIREIQKNNRNNNENHWEATNPESNFDSGFAPGCTKRNPESNFDSGFHAGRFGKSPIRQLG
eukprot:12431294-Karenia_brevis.AAC.1